MKAPDAMQKELNAQLNRELGAWHLYYSMSAYFEEHNFSGFAKWMRKQASEEQVHAQKIYDYLVDRNGTVKLAALTAPKASWNGPLEAFEDAYNHECRVTEFIHGILDAAQKEKDPASASFLQWFIDEQVEEEATALDLVNKLKFVGDNKAALYALDKELGSRE